MGVSNLEARFLPRETRPEKVSQLLCLETKRRRSQLHLPPVSKRNNRPKLDSRNARSFPLHHQSSPSPDPHQAPEGHSRIPATLPDSVRSPRASRTPRPHPFSTPTKFQSRSVRPLRISENSAPNRPRRRRVPPRILVLESNALRSHAHGRDQ